MGKLKMPRKSTNVDMTAMCDVAFLLLTFFMLATQFKPDEPVTVVTPNSISEIPLPDADVMLITIDAKGRIFIAMDNQLIRKEVIQEINEQRGLNLTAEDINKFATGASIGMPFNQLKNYLNASGDEQDKMDETTTGIPVDTSITSENNEFAVWVKSVSYAYARKNQSLTDEERKGKGLRYAIKADGDAPYPEVKDVISTFEGYKIFKFNLITGLKAVPAGTAAYEESMKGVKGK